MCGISAIIRWNEGNLEPIHEMNRLVTHRGPDDHGVKMFRNKIALGHRRLSILDLSSAGHQPMSDQQERFWITYNGEIYNYREIRSELQKLGFSFRTQTDTEVILAAFEAWGVECLSRFNGMFAFVLYDTSTEKVFVVRDRFGVKPLYYYPFEGGVAIASEIKQFTALKEWKFSQNGQRVYDFLNWGVLDHTDETMFSGVKQLRGGHYFYFSVMSLRDQFPKALPWYTLKSDPYTGSFKEATENYRELLLDSIRLRLHADVDVGFCLSGGLDSSAIVCLAHQLLGGSSERLKTFTACSEEARFDETSYVDEVVRKTRVDSYKVTPRAKDLFGSLSSLVWHQDEPFISTSIFAQWEVFHLAKQQGIKVVLDGQGADEQLGGYHGFFANHLFDLMLSLKWKQLISEAQKTKRKHAHLPLMMMLANKCVPEILQQRIRKWFGKSSWSPSWMDFTLLGASAALPYPSQHPFYQQSIQQIFHSSVPMLLHFEDRNSMAHSIESRTPFLDYRLVEFTLNCPTEYKVFEGTTKRMLRSAAGEVLPNKITERNDKMGFLTAEEIWFRKQSPEQLLEYVKKAIDFSNGVILPTFYDQTQSMLRGERPFDFTYWRGVCYGMWLERFSINASLTSPILSKAIP